MRRMIRHVLPVVVLTLIGTALTAPLRAQSTGTITGRVTDAATGDPLRGVQVQLLALGTGILSRAEGQFVLLGVPAGTHEIQAVMIGHLSVSRSVTVTAGETVSVELRMEPTVLHLHEVVVTGTAFAESPTELPYAIAVAGRRTLAEQGAPQVVDFFRNLGAAAGILGERQSWYNASPPAAIPETVASVNLRGLGASRTLALLNGRRQVYVPARLPGGRFVDVNVFPSIAIERIEVLKEGASAIYGSDAVAGVANFLTRAEFEGFEVTAAHEYLAGAGDTNAGAIWGGEIGENAHAVVSAEVMMQRALSAEDRDWALRPFTSGGGAWSYTGNPGAFLMPRLTGSESKEEFVAALSDAQFGGWGGVFLDPQCLAFGGHVESATCRFRYQPWDNLLEANRHIRAFAEVNGNLGDETSYHVEALWAQASTPAWFTTPSYPPISPYNGAQVIEPGNPGRREFCGAHGQSAGFSTQDACLENDWYFYGRLVGNSGPGRELRRDSRTSRVSASLERGLQVGGRDATFEVSGSFSRAVGNVNLPAEYAYRKFLAFRGFGGPGCSVSVVVDPSSPSGMALGNLNGAVAGQGGCTYYNPFSNAHQYSAQPGARYRDQANPDYVAGLDNSADLIDWINEEVNLDNSSSLLVGDVLLKGELIQDMADYAVGYQFRRVDVSATPNRAGDLTFNPCPVPGDRSCVEKAGAFTFTNGFYPYDDAQTVHRLYGEVPLHLSERVHAHLAANYEFHELASSFDPKVAVRVQLAEALALRGSLQTTFRTPSVDDLNEDQNTGLEYVSEAGIYKAVDTHGNSDLEPEQALTYNVGVALELPRMRATLDYWDYDFQNVIDVVPFSGVTRLYDMGGASRAAVQQFVTCPDGRGTGTCDTSALERIEVRHVNWPGIEMSGLDWHLSTRLQAGEAILSLGSDGTYLRRYFVKALDLNGAEAYSAQNAVGKLNWGNPIAPPLPRWKSRFSAGYHWGDYSLVSYVNAVSSYTNEVFPDTEFENIDSFITWDLSLLRRASGSADVALSILNLLDSDPPLVNWEQSYDGFTHSPRGRRIKMSVVYRPGG